MPIFLKIIIFVLLLLLQIGLFNLILALKTNQDHDMSFTKIEFEIIFLFIALSSILSGIFFINIFRSWSPEMLVEKMENIVTINNLILSLQQKKILLIEQTPILKQLDTIKVNINDKTERIKK